MARILIVDDDPISRSVLTAIVSQCGHACFEAENSAAAVLAKQEHAIDIIMTDVFMPGVDGLELMEILRKSNPDIKFIVFSGGNEMFDADTASSWGELFHADAVLQKPFNREEVMAALDAIGTSVRAC